METGLTQDEEYRRATFRVLGPYRRFWRDRQVRRCLSSEEPMRDLCSLAHRMIPQWTPRRAARELRLLKQDHDTRAPQGEPFIRRALTYLLQMRWDMYGTHDASASRIARGEVGVSGQLYGWDAGLYPATTLDYLRFDPERMN